MNIQQLEYLLAVDKYKHFGKAAQACFITQPTLSAMVQKLEDELDVKVFDRTSHPIRTTDIGTEILAEARKVIDAVNELRNTADALNNRLGGRLTVGIIPTVSTYLITSALVDFVKANDKIELEIKEITTDNIIKSLKSGEIHAGIIATPYGAADEFHQDPLFNEELMLYSSRGEAKADTYIVPDEIDVNDVWLLEEGNCLNTQFENICHLKANTRGPQNLNFRASNIHTLIEMVDRVGGICIIPELAKNQLTEQQCEKILRFRKPFPYREISLIYYKPTYKQKMIDALTAHIRKNVSPLLNFAQEEADFQAVQPQ